MLRALAAAFQMNSVCKTLAAGVASAIKVGYLALPLLGCRQVVRQRFLVPPP